MVNITGYGKATQEAVNNFEQYVGFEIPADYKQFLLEYNGGTTTVQNCKFYVDAIRHTCLVKCIIWIRSSMKKNLIYRNGMRRTEKTYIRIAL